MELAVVVRNSNGELVVVGQFSDHLQGLRTRPLRRRGATRYTAGGFGELHGYTRVARRRRVYITTGTECWMMRYCSPMKRSSCTTCYGTGEVVGENGSTTCAHPVAGERGAAQSRCARPRPDDLPGRRRWRLGGAADSIRNQRGARPLPAERDLIRASTASIPRLCFGGSRCKRRGCRSSRARSTCRHRPCPTSGRRCRRWRGSRA